MAKDIQTCTYCGVEKKKTEFYQSYSVLYKHTKKMSICKDCIVDIYDKYMNKYEDDNKAIYYMCRLTDSYYGQGVYEGAKKQSESQNSNIAKIYFQKVNSMPQYKNKTFDDSETLFIDTSQHINQEELGDNDELDYSDIKLSNETKLFWGKGFSYEDYIFLENELSQWKQTHKCDNQAEITLLREICIKILDIRKSREEKTNSGNLLKELQELMKTASLDPAKANAASAGKSHEAWGVFIKDIEQLRPAEWHDKQEKYKDMDGFIPYIQNYIVRPIQNFITGNRDFQINGNLNSDNNDEEGVD